MITTSGVYHVASLTPDITPRPSEARVGVTGQRLWVADWMVRQQSVGCGA
jgi:hypothetical protein